MIRLCFPRKRGKHLLKILVLQAGQVIQRGVFRRIEALSFIAESFSPRKKQEPPFVCACRRAEGDRQQEQRGQQNLSPGAENGLINRHAVTPPF